MKSKEQIQSCEYYKIYKKRIEDVAKRYSWSHDTIGVDKETFETESFKGGPIDVKNEVRVPVFHEMEVAVKFGANFILRNMWISVDEDLPPYDKPVIAIEYDPDLPWEEQRILFAHRSENSDVVTDNNKFCVYPPTIMKITHWIPVPYLENNQNN